VTKLATVVTTRITTMTASDVVVEISGTESLCRCP
jgi:hypothetical protein